MNLTQSRTTRFLTTAGVLAALVAAAVVTSSAATAQTAPRTAGQPVLGGAPVSRSVPAAEQRAAARADVRHLEKVAGPADAVAGRALPAGAAPVAGADGPALRVSGIAPLGSAAPTASKALSSTAVTSSATVTGVLWPGARTANPNRQVGKLYYDKNPSPTVADWGWCTATAINSENKSTVLTAGHCVWDTANARWFTNAVFYPGYENGAYGAAFTVRRMSTTGNYYSGGYSADDMAVVVVNTDSAGRRLVDAFGGHGIAFNQNVNMMRTSFGYPVTDWRWPGFTATGEDMYYCQGADSYYSTGSFAGQMVISCRMTGGASGGPWLSNVAQNWMGTAMSVNSNKGGTGAAWADWMFGPYMGAQEQQVFQGLRAA